MLPRMFLRVLTLAFFLIFPSVCIGAEPPSPSAVSPFDPSTPPFITSSAKPNVLIILDNSNSMDEDFYGNVVGSWSPVSKSSAARQALLDMIRLMQNHVRIGLMSYKLAGAQKYHIYGSAYFASYNPESYCPNPSPECVEYCVDPSNISAKKSCQDACPATFNPDYFDRIISTNPINSDIRKKYCSMFYPKTFNDGVVYYAHLLLPTYSAQDLGNKLFCYSSDANYRPYDGPYSSGYPWNFYRCWRNKTGPSDGFGTSAGYSNPFLNILFEPTDTDYAYGILNFGQRLAFFYVGRTWYQNGSPGGGYLHVPIGEPDEILDQVLEKTRLQILEEKLDPKTDNETAYMQCDNSDVNTCPYIINAGLTPTEGTLQEALNYFQSSPGLFNLDCRKTYVVYVTDGLPSVDKSGNESSASQLMKGVLDKIDDLREISVGGKRHDVKTYILGVGLNNDDKKNLDEMAVHGGTAVDGKAYYADTKDELLRVLRDILWSILSEVSSGTSVSILSERSKKESNVMQAVFYPQREFGNDKKIDWLGYLYAYWFHDSRSYSHLYEDSNQDKKLNLTEDCPIEFNFDNGQLLVTRTDPKTGEPKDHVSLDDVQPLWEAGEKLFRRSHEERTIYTVGGNSSNEEDALVSFDKKNLSKFRKWMGIPEGKGNSNAEKLEHRFHECLRGSSDNETYGNLVDYVRGKDLPGCRNRTADLMIKDVNGTMETVTNTWKLGDIVYSTPKVTEEYRFCSSNPNKSCARDEDCGDNGRCEVDGSLVFFGANDGMLHAVKAGYIKKLRTGDDVAELKGQDVGEEVWAFIPKNALPYLRKLADPDYKHLYYVDLTPYITTLGGKKILIGGMRLGGNVCLKVKDENTYSYNCYAPKDTCANSSNCVGLSSYFALDITEPYNPRFLWEFTHPDLGFSFSGPAVVRRIVNSQDKYFVVFLSGPTDRDGGVDDNQNLNVFVIELNDDLTKGDVTVLDLTNTNSPGVQNFKTSFGGRLFTDGLDMDGDGQTDYNFFGYSKSSGQESSRFTPVQATLLSGFLIQVISTAVKIPLLPRLNT